MRNELTHLTYAADVNVGPVSQVAPSEDKPLPETVTIEFVDVDGDRCKFVIKTFHRYF